MKQPIRVLHVFAEMNRGGAETMIMELYRYIDKSEFQFDFVVHTQDKCAYDDEIKKMGGNIYSVPKYNGKNHFHYKKAWNNFFNSHFDYDIVHGHVRSTASVYLKIAKKYKIKTVAHSHNTSSGFGISSFVKNVLQYQIRNTSDYFLACSISAGKWLFGTKIIEGDHFVVLNNAIEAEKFKYDSLTRRSIRKELKIEGKSVIGHVGRFHSQKNHEFIIEVFKNIKIKNKNTILLLVGDGDLKPLIEEKVMKEKLVNDVVFLGSRSDVSFIFQAMDVFLMPSLFEGLPVTLIEAQASGLECIVSDTITSDVKITNLVSFVPLQKGSDYWSEVVLKKINEQKRIDTSKKIIEASYDIKENTRKISEFYKLIIGSCVKEYG